MSTHMRAGILFAVSRHGVACGGTYGDDDVAAAGRIRIVDRDGEKDANGG